MSANRESTRKGSNARSTLTVISQTSDPPRTGAKVGVKGTFQALLSLGIKSLAVLKEESRSLKD